MNQQKLETITLLAEAAVSVANALNKLVDYTTAQGIDPSIMQAPMASHDTEAYTCAVAPEGIDNSADGEAAAAPSTESVAATKKPATRKPAAKKPANAGDFCDPKTEEPQPDPKPSKDEPAEAEAQDLLTIGDTVSEESTDNVAETKESNAETKESIAEATGVTLAAITSALSRAISAGSIVKTDVKTWLEDFDVKALSDLDADQRDAFYNKHSDVLGELK